jgi:hypothetical protein
MFFLHIQEKNLEVDIWYIAPKWGKMVDYSTSGVITAGHFGAMPR